MLVKGGVVDGLRGIAGVSISPQIGPPVQVRMSQEKTILEEAASIVDGERAKKYGPVSEDFERNVGMFNALFSHKIKTPLVAADWPLVMIIVKLSRLVFTEGHRDSLVDIAGYARTAEMVQSEKKEEK